MGELNMNKVDRIFKDTIKKVLEEGMSTEGHDVRPVYVDGKPAHTTFINHECVTYDISKDEFPLPTLRPIAIKSGIKEILWIYQDQTSDLKVLREKYGIGWWDEWDIGGDTIGQRYGATVRKYDLMNKLLKSLREQPYGRRHIIDLYQYTDFEETKGLNPCAFMTMWSVRGEFLDMTLVQRSSDYLVAGHINEMQYVALQMMVARHLGYKAGKFTHYTENLHIYDRHFEQARILLERTPSDKQPKLILKEGKTNFYDFTIDDFEVVDYEPVKPQLKFELGI
jgi:thymidylate synthase